MKKVLGLDIGTNSIGFALNEVYQEDGKITFNELASNSIIFSSIEKAEDRRNFRSGRRRNERSSRRRKNVRKLFTYFDLADKSIIDDATNYFNKISQNIDPYKTRQAAVEGKKLTKDEFVFCTYSIITRRGYSNQFKTEDSKDDGVINSSISKNKSLYQSENLVIPSMVLTKKKDELENQGFTNIAIRNKKDNYNNSLDRGLWQEELELLLDSQKDNDALFSSTDKYEEFKDKLLNGMNEFSMGAFEQRPLKSMEHMVGYCTFYNEHHSNKQKRVSKTHISNIELILRQRIENSILGNLIINSKTGEIYELTKDEIENTIEFWLKTPSVKKITAGNIFSKSLSVKNIKINTSENQDDSVLDISVHKQLIEIFEDTNIDIFNEDKELYSKIIETIYYYVNKNQIVNKLRKLDVNNKLNEEVINQLSNIDKGSAIGYASYSLKFIDEILIRIKEGNSFHDSLQSMGYFNKYIGMKAYEYLPPLNPSSDDIIWLEKNVTNFKKEELFYQPLISPAVRGIISNLRRLVNDLIKRYGKIDQIIIETASELNSKTEEERIKNSQKALKQEKDKAEKILLDNGFKVSGKNIERVRLFQEQKAECLYSGKPLTLEDALDEETTEVEHFIPRSVIWINSYKNKILVLKSENQNKGNKNPFAYLSSNHRWEDFSGRVWKSIANKNKKIWLTNQESIESQMKQENLEDRFLNDTRSATRIVSNYLRHYLFPKQNEFGKGETNTDVITVTGKAISELKYLWGVKEVQPTNEEGNKDRQTHYHHTIDAIVISLLNNSSKKALNDFFKQKENKFKTKAIIEDIKTRFPITKDGISLVDFVKQKVDNYENHRQFVYHNNRSKQNVRGFKDSNIKLLWDDENETFYQLDNESIDRGLIFDSMRNKYLSDKETKDKLDSILNRLDLPKQQKIYDAIISYTDKLLAIKNEALRINDEVKELSGKLPKGRKYEDTTETLDIKAHIKALKDELNHYIEIQNEPCFFTNKNGQKQIIRNLKLKSKSQTSVDCIIVTDKTIKNRVKRLTPELYKELKDKKIPFVAKLNDATVSVDLFNTDKGQIIGLNYFSSVKNNISPKINNTKVQEIKDFTDKSVIKDGDILYIEDFKNNISYPAIQVGGGDISGSSNRIMTSSINFRNQNKRISLNKDRVVKRIKINYYGEIINESIKE